jgi:hypothetical protein
MIAVQLGFLDQPSPPDKSVSELRKAWRSSLLVPLSALMVTKFDVTRLDGTPFSTICRLIQDREKLFTKSTVPTPETIVLAYLERLEPSIRSEALRREKHLGGSDCDLLRGRSPGRSDEKRRKES